MSPPKQKRRRGKTALQDAEQQEAYCLLAFLQPLKAKARRCISCRARVTNRNLGGFNGRSARSGSLFCLRCADWPSQLLLNLGGTR